MSGHDVLIACLCAGMCLTPLVLAVILSRLPKDASGWRPL